MSALLRAGAVSLLAVSLVACGGGGGNGDEDAIEELVKQFFRAFEDGDSAALAALFGQECGDMTAAATTAVDQYEAVGDVKVDLESVRIQNLKDTSAEFLPEGTITTGGETSDLSSQGDEFTLTVKENGVWKIAECQLFQ